VQEKNTSAASSDLSRVSIRKTSLYMPSVLCQNKLSGPAGLGLAKWPLRMSRKAPIDTPSMANGSDSFER